MAGPIADRGAAWALPWAFAAWAAGAAAQEPVRPAAPKAGEPPGKTGKTDDPDGPAPKLPNPLDIAECRQAIEKYKAKDLDGCYKLLGEAVAKQPELPPAKVMLAALLVNNREVRAARALMEQAAVEHAEHPEVYRQFAELALGEGRFAEAEAMFNVARLKASEDRWSLPLRRAWQAAAVTGLAAVEEQRRAWDKAWRHLDFVLKLDRRDKGIRFRLARAMFLAQAGSADDALVQFRECHDADPRFDPPELALGGLWMQKGDLAKAETLVRAAVAKYPKDVRTHAGLTAMLIRQGRVKEAGDALGPARALQPDSSDLRVFAAVIARAQGRFDLAEEALQPAVVKEPGNYAVSNQMALTLVEQDDAVKRKRGLEIARMNARLHQGNAEAVTTLGWALYRNGEKDEADKSLASVVNVGQASSDCAYFMAVLAAERKDPERARKLCETALASPGTFVHREECQRLFKAVAALAPAPAGKDAGKDSAKAPAGERTP